MNARLHVFVSGKVQGVSYRGYARRAALELGLKGWVRNLWRRISPPQPKAAPPRLSGVMVKDEACLTYVPKEDALREVIDGREYFFCSKECRKKFLSDKKSAG